MQILLIFEHLFYKYFVRRSVGEATKSRNVKKKCDERFRDFFSLDFRYNFPNIFIIISKSFATYGCCRPCFYLKCL